jgi:RNA polymerase sigma-70 factor (ECF subfamily)
MVHQNSNWLTGLIQGDKDIFQKLYFEFYPKLYHFSFDLVKNSEIARDIVNETFVKLWETKNELRSDSNLEAYLITIARNKCFNFLKHKKIILQFQEIKTANSAELNLWEQVFTDNSFSTLDYEILKKKVDSAISNLPEQCRNVFLLSRFKRKKYSEIAAILKISQKTVEAHISLALKRLRDELQHFL